VKSITSISPGCSVPRTIAACGGGISCKSPIPQSKATIPSPTLCKDRETAQQQKIKKPGGCHQCVVGVRERSAAKAGSAWPLLAKQAPRQKKTKKKHKKQKKKTKNKK
jgi:hypothetical protein